MNTYGIIVLGGDVVTVGADYYLIDSGFVRFYTYGADDVGGQEEIASYRAEFIESVVRQKQYTEAEVIAQIEGKE